MTGMNDTCSVVGCGKKGIARTFCPMHYRRFMLHGDPLKIIRRPNGSGTISVNGYHMIGVNGKRANYGHIIIAEKALGRKLKAPELVHHVNCVESDNRPENLVICPNQAYHFLIHQRTRAYDACGHAHWRKCKYCKKYDDPSVMGVSGNGMVHKACANAYAKAARIRRLTAQA